MDELLNDGNEVYADITIPGKLIPVFESKSRYKGAYGGRGSAKTRTFALMTAVEGYRLAEAGASGIILCGREYMNSLNESSLEEIKQAIKSVSWLNDYYEIGEKYVRTKNKRIAYAFTGLRHNLDSIKGKSRILLAWVDEAENVSEAAWRKLLPTVREDDSEVWITWNPENKGSATDKRFRQVEHEFIVEMNYNDNPFFPDVLEQERLNDQANLDDATYCWIWEGAYLEASDAQIFNGKFIVKEFERHPTWNGPYNGLDFGFSTDPTGATSSWVHDGILYIEHEACKVGLEIDDTPDYLKDNIPGIENYELIADNARPESISYLKRNGIPKIKACVKGKGSVEDGIAHLKGYKQIVIHPRCTATAKEFRLYSYKTDRLSGEILPEIIDKHNHLIDSLRYAHERTMKRGANTKRHRATAGKRTYR